MADVFLAQDTSRGGRLVALKRMRDPSPDMMVRFAREARIGALLVHPNVVRVEDAGQDAEGPFIVLEFVDGLSASALLRFFAGQRTPLPLELWLVIAQDMAAGLHYAHSARLEDGSSGVLHRDLSPDNVLISREGVAKLSDFGVAYVEGDTRVTRTGTLKGKLTYLAPELFEGVAYSTASDVYALGVTLFKLAAGVAPFRGGNDGVLVRNILQGERPALSALRPDLPGSLAAWVQQAIGLRPGDRPQMKALVKLLSAVDGAPRVVLAQAVVSACARAPSSLPSIPEPLPSISGPLLSTPRTSAMPAGRLPSASPGAQGARAEPTEPLLPALAEAQGVSAVPTTPCLPALAESQGVNAVPTTPLLPAMAEPQRPVVEPSASFQGALSEPTRKSAEPTERVEPALAEPRELSAVPTTLLRSVPSKPRGASAEPTERRQPALLKLHGANAEPTERVEPALPEPMTPLIVRAQLPPAAITTRLLGRARRAPVWVGLALVALGLASVLVVRACTPVVAMESVSP
jgi:serine/threonine protein kinase